MRRILIFDTTLRDGEQSPGASLNVDEKLVIAKQLESLGVDVIEAGFPISSSGDFDSVRLIAEKVRRPVICGLARAVDQDIDAAARALEPARRRRIHTFIATSRIHMEKKLKMKPEEVLERARAAVKRARQYTDDVEFSPEDATRSELTFLCQVVEAAIDAGATTVNIPDTVGYSEPEDFEARIRALLERVPNIRKAVLSVHCHNDLGLAVANSLAAVKAGASQVECTINGIGERAGNASLEEIVMALRQHRESYQAETSILTQEIWNSSRLVSNLTGLEVQRNKAIVGENAFAHEAGIHQHGVIQDPETYEIIRAEDVGWQGNQLSLGKHSGKHGVEKVLKERGYLLEPDQLSLVVQRVKEVADRQKRVEEDDVVAIARDVMNDLTPDEQLMVLKEVSVMTGNGFTPSATIKLALEGKEVVGTGTGVGPVDAAAHALASLVRAHVGHTLRLAEYGLKAITGGTDALAHANIRFEDEAGDQFRGEAVHADVIIASVQAMVKGANRAMNFQKRSRSHAAEGSRNGGRVSPLPSGGAAVGAEPAPLPLTSDGDPS
jgi:2-isopropylmalate synthase